MQEDLDKVIKRLSEVGIPVKQTKLHFNFRNAKALFTEHMQYFLSIEQRKLQWQTEYDEIVDWLTDTKGRGLFLYGNCGRGKSLIAQHVLPSIFLREKSLIMNVYNIQELSTRLDEILNRKIVCIDDIGTEPPVINNFGTKRFAFPEIIDMVEKKSNMIIITSNLDGDGIRKYYDERTFQRIISTTKRIEFKGKSLRQ